MCAPLTIEPVLLLLDTLSLDLDDACLLQLGPSIEDIPLLFRLILLS